MDNNWPAFFNENLARLDEYAGTLRPNVPEDKREPGGAWVQVRRYIPGGINRELDAESRNIDRTLTWHDATDGHLDSLTGRVALVADLSEAVIEGRNLIGYRRAEAYIQSWSYTGADGQMLPITVEVLRDIIPEPHVDAILRQIVELRSPKSDAATFPVSQASEQLLQVSEPGRNGAREPAAVHPDAGLGDPRP